MVCSLGARHLDDPQIDDENGSLYSAGWKWHRQVRGISVALRNILICLGSRYTQALDL
jgi:hypothetical protein